MPQLALHRYWLVELVAGAKVEHDIWQHGRNKELGLKFIRGLLSTSTSRGTLLHDFLSLFYGDIRLKANVERVQRALRVVDFLRDVGDAADEAVGEDEVSVLGGGHVEYLTDVSGSRRKVTFEVVEVTLCALKVGFDVLKGRAENSKGDRRVVFPITVG